MKKCFLKLKKCLKRFKLNFDDVVKNDRLRILTLVLLGTILVTTGYSYAYFTKSIEVGVVNIQIGNISYSLESESLNENYQVTAAAGEQIIIDTTVTGLDNVASKYQMYYTSDNDLTDVTVGYSSESINLPYGAMNANGTKNVMIVIQNNSSSDVTVSLGVAGGLNKNPVDDIVLKDNQYKITEYVSTAKPELETFVFQNSYNPICNEEGCQYYSMSPRDQFGLNVTIASNGSSDYVKYMFFSHDDYQTDEIDSLNAWIPYENEYEFQLQPINTTQTIYAYYKDAFGNIGKVNTTYECTHCEAYYIYESFDDYEYDNRLTFNYIYSPEAWTNNEYKLVSPSLYGNYSTNSVVIEFKNHYTATLSFNFGMLGIDPYSSEPSDVSMTALLFSSRDGNTNSNTLSYISAMNSQTYGEIFEYYLEQEQNYTLQIDIYDNRMSNDGSQLPAIQGYISNLSISSQGPDVMYP